MRAGADVEALGRRAPVVVDHDEHDRAVRVAEGDVPGVARHRRADAHRARADEARHVAEDVVVGGRASRGRSRDRSSRRRSTCRSRRCAGRPAGSSARFQVMTVLAQLRTAPTVRKRVCQCRVSGNVVAGFARTRARALGEVDVLLGIGVVQRRLALGIAGVAVERGAGEVAARRPGWRAATLAYSRVGRIVGRPDVVGVQRPVVVVAEDLRVQAGALQRAADRDDQPRLLVVAQVHARIAARDCGSGARSAA